MSLNPPDRSLVKRALAGAAASLALAVVTPMAVAQAQAPATAAIAGLPDFTPIVAQAEGSVVNIRTAEAVPVRRSPMGPGADPSELFRWFFGPDFMPPGVAPQTPQRPRGQPRGQTPQERTVPRGIGSGFIIS